MTVGEAAAPADVAPRQLPPVMAHAHSVSARATTEPGEADFGKALQRWLDLERQRISGEFSHLDQVQAVAEAYATPGSAAPEGVMPERTKPRTATGSNGVDSTSTTKALPSRPRLARE